MIKMRYLFISRHHRILFVSTWRLMHQLFPIFIASHPSPFPTPASPSPSPAPPAPTRTAQAMSFPNPKRQLSTSSPAVVASLRALYKYIAIVVFEPLTRYIFVNDRIRCVARDFPLISSINDKCTKWELFNL